MSVVVGYQPADWSVPVATNGVKFVENRLNPRRARVCRGSQLKDHSASAARRIAIAGGIASEVCCSIQRASGVKNQTTVRIRTIPSSTLEAVQHLFGPHTALNSWRTQLKHRSAILIEVGITTAEPPAIFGRAVDRKS